MNPQAAPDLPPIVTQTADLLAALAPSADADLVRRTAVLLGRARAEGHACVELAEHAGSREGADGAALPAVADWTAQLLRSGLCGDGGTDTPLVVRGGRLWMLRHFRAEQRIAAFVRERLAQPALLPPAAIAAVMAPTGGQDRGPDWQSVAVFSATRHGFAVLTGGPGTGKTTTVARLFATLRRLQPDLRAAFCAPTGKAAARLQQAIAERGRALGVADLHAQATALTLHRLLGYLPVEDAFLHGRERPLPYDLVVVDEASMVDLALFDALVAALRPQTRLVLVGDHDQLASVATGQVFGDLCRVARATIGVGHDLAAAWAEAFGTSLPRRQDDHPLANVTVALRQNHRFASQPGIGAFAQALQARDPDGAVQALHAGHPDLRLLPPDAVATVTGEVQQRAAAVLTADEPRAALAILQQSRILCAVRSGPAGVLAWNRRVEASLRAAGHRLQGPWYRGRPLLITANDPQTRLFNGDVGVAWPDADGRDVAWFADGDAVRAVATVRLPAHETAWAMTVHKAQGSEFAEVILAMPDQPGPSWQAPLIYTGVTRAQQRATVVADPAQLALALARWPARDSGLGEALDG